jgi:hypothetical protein
MTCHPALFIISRKQQEAIPTELAGRIGLIALVAGDVGRCVVNSTAGRPSVKGGVRCEAVQSVGTITLGDSCDGMVKGSTWDV